MGVEELRTEIERQGRARVAAISSESAAEAARVREEAARDAERRRAERLAREEAALRGEARSRVASARSAQRRRLLEAREALLERVFARAEDALSQALVSPDARAWLLDRAREAFAHLPEGAVRIAASKGVGPTLAEAFAEREDVRVEEDPELPAGFRASSADGAVVVDATAGALIGRARATLAIDVVQRLRREPTPGGDDA